MRELLTPEERKLGEAVAKAQIAKSHALSTSKMKCPYCNEFKGNNKVKGYTVKEQLSRHIEVSHQIDRV